MAYEPPKPPERMAPNLERVIGEAAANSVRDSREPPRPQVVSMPRVSDGPTDNLPSTASTVSKRLELLIKGTSDLRKQAEILAVALTGLETADGTIPVPRKVHGAQSLFSRQMLALDELALLLDSVRNSIERANRSLA